MRNLSDLDIISSCGFVVSINCKLLEFKKLNFQFSQLSLANPKLELWCCNKQLSQLQEMDGQEW
jgi:hypothetical protein